MTASDSKGALVLSDAEKELVSSSPAMTPEMLDEFGDFGQAKSSSEIAIPFLSILQKGSPEVNKRDEKYVNGAEPGMLINTLSKELFTDQKQALLIPIDHITRWVEWVPRESGGGLVGSFAEKPRGLISQPDTGKLVNSIGNYVNETIYQLALDSETFSPVVVAFASSNITTFRRWKGLCQSQRIGGKLTPAFFRLWAFDTEYKKNEKGDWFIYHVTDKGWLSNEKIAQAAIFARQCKAEGFEVGRPPEDTVPDHPASSKSHGPVIDGEMPF